MLTIEPRVAMRCDVCKDVCEGTITPSPEVLAKVPVDQLAASFYHASVELADAHGWLARDGKHFCPEHLPWK